MTNFYVVTRGLESVLVVATSRTEARRLSGLRGRTRCRRLARVSDVS